MIRFLGKRLLQTVPVLVGLTVLLFLWVRALPGNPAKALLGETATPEAVAQIERIYGFDQPVHIQFFRFVRRLLSGDFGASIKTGEQVVSSFFSRFPATIELAFVALVFAAVVGIPLGYLAARRHGSLFDSLVVGSSLFGVVVPVFFLAYILKYLFALKLRWFPTAGRQNARLDADHPTGFYVFDGIITGEWHASWDALMHLALPAIALGAIPLAIIVRITRASVLDTLGEDFLRTARAKGLTSAVITRRHILRPSMLPVVTIFGLQAGALLAGAVLTETVFAINGIGSYLFEAINTLDYPVLQAYILFIALIYVIVNLLVDISYGLIDPRARVQ